MLLCAAGLSSPVAYASNEICDDIILTDGRKISGVVVGMEKDSFRIETDFGVALVRKDKILRIEVTPKPATAAPASAPPPPAPPVVKSTPAAPTPSRKPAAVQERKPPSGQIEEHVDSGTYFNDSFGFQMYKPPNWKVLDDTARAIPSAVAALGTEDEATLMIVGTVRFDGPTSAYANVLASALKKLYSDYESKPEEQIEVAGLPAIRHSFSGNVDGKQWHGIVVNLADGPIHYGIIGLTSEENYQFKGTVLSKMIASFRFK
jgi:hypothetical protein